MFLSKFSRGKTNFALSLCRVLLTAVLILGVTGCPHAPDEPEQNELSVYGKWVDDWQGVYEISETYFKNYGPGYSSYEGSDVTVVPLSETSGTIFIKYTVAAMPDWSYSSEAPDVGKWYAVSYKDLTENSISLAGAYGTKSSAETLEEAKTEFTVENGYFGTYSACVLSK